MFAISYKKMNSFIFKQISTDEDLFTIVPSLRFFKYVFKHHFPTTWDILDIDIIFRK